MDIILKFTNEDGKAEEVEVSQERFLIGRHSENDLSIVNSKLSRTHLKIERFADVFVVSDCESSNGTKLNGEELSEPQTLANGDILDLGGGVEIEIEFPGETKNDAETSGKANSDEESEEEDSEYVSANAANASSGAVSLDTSAGSSSSFGLRGLLFLTPLLAIFLVLSVVGAFLLFGGKSVAETTQNEDDPDFIYSDDRKDEEIPNKNMDTGNLTPKKTPVQNPVDPNPVNTEKPEAPPSNNESPAKPSNNNTRDKTAKSSALSFLRRIGRNDPNPVLTRAQLGVIQSKTNQFRNSTALASNIKNAKRNASKIEALARSNNLKPQFLANAALTKLSKNRGDVAATAQSMIAVLNNLTISLGNEFANDQLLVIAAYDQGIAGDNLVMRNTIGKLLKQSPNTSSRQIRTIWFLHDKRKLTKAQFEFVLRFLAIGTITQNPKAFKVNSEALIF